MVTVSLAQAKARLSELLDKVEAGEEVVVTRHGRAVARISPAAQPKKPHRITMNSPHSERQCRVSVNQVSSC